MACKPAAPITMREPEPVLLCATDGPVATLTLHRPDKRNALNVELLEQFCAMLERLAANSSQRVLVLRGSGTVFCAGMDLAEATQPERAGRSAELIQSALQRLATTRLITIAAVHGAAIAGGAGVAAACDFVIAARDTKFGFPEVHRGLVPALIMTFLRRQLRERDARELLLLGSLFDAQHARQIGLVNRVVADEEAAVAEARAIAVQLLEGAPEALSETKRLLMATWPASVADDLARAHAVHLSARNSAEAREGFAAFNEKRRPKWQG